MTKMKFAIIEDDDVNLLWDLVEYRGFSAENIKDVKLYDARELLNEYLIEHGKEFQKKRDTKIWREGAKRYLLGGIFETGTTGICYAHESG